MLREGEAGFAVAEFVSKHGISRDTYLSVEVAATGTDEGPFRAGSVEGRAS
jgi:hypothetical protein